MFDLDFVKEYSEPLNKPIKNNLPNDLFIWQVAGNKSMYRGLQEMGYILVFKPTMQYMKEGKKEIKGNVDAELVLYSSAITFNDYDKAIIVSGDGDFYCLIEFWKIKINYLN